LYCVAGEGMNEKQEFELPVEQPEFDEPIIFIFKNKMNF
jgi:hypothetical protein